MAGLESWFEVMKAGTHTDSAGRTWTFTAEDIDEIALNYNPQQHEAPIVIGHPQEDMPAWGWVAELKSEGGILFARAKDVVSEFADMVKKKMFPKRSIALYPGRKLKHVGFLGAVPPAVKGLKDIQFKDDPDAVTIEFSESSNRWAFNTIADVVRRLREYFIEKEGTERVDTMLPHWLISDIQAAAKAEQAAAAPMYSEKPQKKEETMGLKDLLKRKIDELPDDLAGAETPPAGQFSAADIEKAKQEAIAEGKRQAAAEFAEQRRQDRADSMKVEVAAFCEGLKKEGKLLPAWEKLGLVELMEFLGSQPEETVIEFSEGPAQKKSSPLDIMKAFLSELPKTVKFSEVARRDNSAAAGGTAGDKLDALARKMMVDRKDLTFNQAFAEVQRENQDLAREYEIEIRGGD